MRTLVARAPTRLDFGGGWTDVPPYSDEEGGVVCNVAIARFATVRVSPEQGAEMPSDPLARAAMRRAGVSHVRLSIESDFPVGAGLGGSSAAGVAVAGALARWQGRPLAGSDLAENSRTTEVEELGIAGGRQDHYAAVFGGALELTFENGATTVRRLQLDSDSASRLADRTVVAYTGQSRISADTINGVLAAYVTRQPRVVSALARMKQIAKAQARAIERSDFDDLGHLVGEHWAHQRALHPGITTELIDAVVERATAAGALGVKALGASGGGCVLAIARAESRDAVRAAIASLAEPLPIVVDRQGFAVIEDTGAVP